MNHTREKIQEIFLVVTDLICFLISYFGAGYVWLVEFRKVSITNMRIELMDSFYLTFIAYLLIVIFSDLEKNYIGRNYVQELIAAIKSGAILMVVMTLTIFVKHNNADISRGVYIVTAFFDILLFYITHVIIKYYLLRVYRNKSAVNQIFLVTNAERVDAIVKDADSTKDWARRITGIAIIDDNQVGRWYYGVPVVATYDNMVQYATEQIVDEVFIDVPYDNGESLKGIVNQFAEMGATVHVSIELLQRFDEFHKSFDMMGNIPVVTFSNQYYDWKMLMIKRIMDIAGAIVGLAITAVVTVFLAPPLLIESPGPLFFSQKRVGKNGRFFKLYKFRSMYKDAEERKKELERLGYVKKIQN